MVLTSFADIGKPGKDLFTKYFKFSLINFDFKSKTEDNVDLHLQCNEVDNKFVAASDVTFKPVDGISVKTKIDSNWLITNDIEIDDKKLSMQHNVITSIDYAQGAKKLKLKNHLKKERVNAEMELDFASKYPDATASIVFGDKGYVAGAQISIGTDGFELKKHVYSLGYCGNEFELHGSLSNNKDFEWRLFQIYKNISVGCMLGWSGGLLNTKFGVAAMYQVDKQTFIKGRIDECGRVGFAYGFKPTPETHMVVAMESSVNRNQPASNCGLTFEISN
uniref:Voltage-dependent anion-selective channel n=1 Tax=Mesocestoides corti TaxID=53468 RepID=A0A5K3ESU4_MESCO